MATVNYDFSCPRNIGWRLYVAGFSLGEFIRDDTVTAWRIIAETFVSSLFSWVLGTMGFLLGLCFIGLLHP